MKHSTLQLNFRRICFAFIFSLFILSEAKAQLTINSAVTPTQLVNSLLGGGITVTNINLNCGAGAYGTFSNGNTTNIGVTSGILLTSGAAVNAIGPNNTGADGTCLAINPNFVDPQLTALEPLATYDVCILEFDMVPTCNNLQIRFVFGSDEYPEFVNSNYNDAFGFFITGPGPACQPGFYNNQNVAILPNSTQVAINNINNGPANAGPCTNCSSYVNNTPGATIEYDAFTTVITTNVTLCPCQTYHFKLAIADAGDCEYDSGVFVDFMQCSTSLSATSSFTPLIGCSGCNATATATATGGNAPYTYSWSPSGGNAAIATGLCAGTYTCTITDAGSCTIPQTVVVTIPSNGGISSSLSTQGNVSCSGGSNGSATVSASGGTPGYTYSWAPSGGNAATATGLAAGTYTVTITDAVGCTTTQQVIISQPSALSASTSGTNISCNGGTDGTAVAVPSGGTPGYSYSWAPSGGNASTATGLGAGTYTVTVTDANGCTTTQQTTLTAPTALTATSSSTNVSCNGGTNGTGAVVASGGSPAYSYSWAPSGGNSSSATGLGAGTYTVTITDANGCPTTQSVTVTQPTPLTVAASNTPEGCSGNDGTATATPTGGTAGYTYSWAPSGGNAATATGLIAGTYTVTVTDANGCISTQSTIITQTSSLSSSVTQTNVSCFGNTNGSATATPIGGTAPFTYSWTSGGTNATENNLAAGSYTVTVTDNSGCIGTSSVTITQPTLLTATSSSTNISCFGGSNGTATVVPAGGTPTYTYAWAPSGGTNATATGLGAGNYTVTVTDANGCTTTQSYTLTQPPTAIAATSNSTNITCFGGTNGTGTIVASGGTPGYTYSWTPAGGTNATANGLAAGSYTCTIADANGCSITQSITVTQPTIITSSATPTNVSCNGGTNGSATITPSGGTPGYTYSWAPSGGTNATATGLSSGTYSCTITDANGCTGIQTITITQPTVLTISTTIDSVCPGTPGVIGAGPSGGTAPYTYAWSNGPTTAGQTLVVTSPTTYSVTVTDANGCTITGTCSIGIYPSPTAAFITNATNGIFQLSAGTGNLCFTDISTDASAWLWNLDGNPSILQSPCLQVSNANAGTFCATLIVGNSSGCFDTTTQCLEIGESYYSIPNVFTPGGDGINDAFVITNVGMKSLSCQIYNRWGELIYEWDGTSGNWNGQTKKGNDAVDGVYYYTAHLVDFADKVFEESGFVQLIRGK